MKKIKMWIMIDRELSVVEKYCYEISEIYTDNRSSKLKEIFNMIICRSFDKDHFYNKFDDIRKLFLLNCKKTPLANFNTIKAIVKIYNEENYRSLIIDLIVIELIKDYFDNFIKNNIVNIRNFYFNDEILCNDKILENMEKFPKKFYFFLKLQVTFL